MPSEAHKQVSILNYELLEKLGEDFFDEYADSMPSYHSDGVREAILFMGSKIWSSEDDEREFIETGSPEDDYEPLGSYLRRKMKSMCEEFMASWKQEM